MSNPYPPYGYPPAPTTPRPSVAGRPTWQGFLTAFLFPFSAVSGVGRAYIRHWWSLPSGKYTLIASQLGGVAAWFVPGLHGDVMTLLATAAQCSLAWVGKVPAAPGSGQPPTPHGYPPPVPSTPTPHGYPSGYPLPVPPSGYPSGYPLPVPPTPPGYPSGYPLPVPPPGYPSGYPPPVPPTPTPPVPAVPPTPTPTVPPATEDW